VEIGDERDIIIDSILDWRDDDTFHRLNGAEDDYYESLPHPYACKDGPFETVEELLLVRGVTPSLFYGTSAGEDDTGEAFSLRKGLADLVTVYSRSNRVEVNSAPKEILMTIPGINEEVATKIIEARKERPLKDLNAIRTALGDAAYAQALQYLTFGSSSVYSIVVTGIMRESGIKRRIKGIVRINLRSAEKYQVVYWADNYPMGGNMIPVSRNPWEKGDEEFS